MRRVLFYLLIFTCCQSASFGQSNPKDTLFTINDTVYSSEAFLNFCKNEQLADTNIYRLTTKEKLDQFILFHLKVKAAEKNNINKREEVLRDLQIYSDIAFHSFLYPTTITEEQIIEAHERIQHYIKVRHILVKIHGHASPKDTLAAYTEAKKIQKYLVKGKSFGKIAQKHSDDQSVKRNNGEIGYFTAFDMDYSFESAAYKLNLHEYSNPIRTQFGYHIIQVMDKIPNPGSVKIRHILLEYNKRNHLQTKQQIDSIHAILKKENQFEKLAEKHSFDKRSANLGGVLPWFGLFETHPKIEKAAFKLKEKNEISNPVKTEFGYHVLQLIDRKDYSSLEECREEISRLISQDSRSKTSSGELLSKIKKAYQFKENRELLSNFYSILDYAYADLWQPLFTIGGIEYSQEDFAAYLSQQASKDIYENFIEYINRVYDNFSNNSILAFYKKQLLENNSALKNRIQNYKNKILVKNITKQKVWLPATNSQFNLLKYYHENRSKYDKNVDFESIKFKVVADYKAYLNAIWEEKLRSEYKIKISQSTFNKIAEK
jgi:peptidyl-prolyl cis-trans isomerase SurA